MRLQGPGFRVHIQDLKLGLEVSGCDIRVWAQDLGFGVEVSESV